MVQNSSQPEDANINIKISSTSPPTPQTQYNNHHEEMEGGTTLHVGSRQRILHRSHRQSFERVRGCTKRTWRRGHPIDDDASQFSSKSFDYPSDRDIFGNSGGRPGYFTDNNATNSNAEKDATLRRKFSAADGLKFASTRRCKYQRRNIIYLPINPPNSI